MRRTPSAITASLAVTQTKLAIEKLGWLFREQTSEDYGIDAQVELVENGTVEGKLIAFQIKGGSSWFSKPSSDGWWYYPNNDHVSYWTKHSLPVIVVLVDVDAERCYWQILNSSTLLKTSGGNWKVLVPREQLLGEGARELLRKAGEGDPYVLRVRELQLARPWMEMLSAGKRLVVDIEEWINKTSGRGSITLGMDLEDGRDPNALAEWGVFLGSSSYATVVPKLFAWADVILHQETYDDADQDLYETECIYIDEEGDRFETETYAEWAAGRSLPELRPYANEMGEVDRWRLELILNELGKSFLVVDGFATTGTRQLTP